MNTTKSVLGAVLLGVSVSALAAQGGMGAGKGGMGPGHMMDNGKGSVTMPMMREHMGMMHRQMQNMPMNGDSEAWQEHRKQMMEQMERHMEMMQKYQEQTENQGADKPKE